MALSLLDANDTLGQHAPSWYAASANPFEEFPAAAGHLTYDVAIVGAGFSGLSSALHLSELGYRVCVLDAHRIGWGASGRNGGQIGSGQRLAQDEMEALVGFEHAKRAFDLGVEACSLVFDLIEKHDIECAPRRGIIEAMHRKRFDTEIRDYVELLNEKYDYHHMRYLPLEEIRNKVGSTNYFSGSIDTHAGHLHPLNYARGLALAAKKAGADLYEMSRVSRVEEGRIATDTAEIKAKTIVLACNGYLGSLDGKVADRVMPINNFIVASEPLDAQTCKALIRDGEAVCDSRFVVNYFRLSQDNRMLFGGGENYTYKFPSDIAKTVRKPMLEVFPQLKDVKIDHAWGGTLAITIKRVPHFEFRKNNIINISGYSGSGVHMATMAGKLVAEAVNGQMSRFDIISQLPTPRFPGGSALRWPLLPLALTWYALRDRL